MSNVAFRQFAARCRDAARGSPARLLNVLFPPHCAYCDADLVAHDGQVLLCNRCQAALGLSTGLRCPRCGGSVALAANAVEGCPHCRDSRFYFQGVTALGVYQGELRSAVLSMKLPTRAPLAMAVAHLMWRERGDEIAASKATVAVPVPMHWSRRLVRGANSAEMLAEVLAGKLRIPARHRMLNRWRNTRPQGSLPPGKRWSNMRGALRMRRGYQCRSAHVLLVDDVLTTGSTASESARVLLEAGAAAVTVAVVARGEGLD